jgi:hypothetical protein
MKTIDQVRDQVLGPLWEEDYTDEVGVQALQVCRVRDQVWGQVYDQVWGQIEHQVWLIIEHKVWLQVGGQVRRQVWEEVNEND